MDRAACTIIAKNYIAFGRTLAQSFVSFHPDHKMYVLIVDDFEGYISRANESFEIVTLSDLNIPNVQTLCFKYDIKELCTAVKARLLEYLLQQKSVDQLLYLDPDILVTSSLDELYEKLGTYDIILTPHIDASFPDDSLLPDDGFILRAGQFNLGFIGLNSSENARTFLKWWKPKLYENCVVDLLNGYFVDQKFIDFVPILFDNFWIERDTGYNVAYWNLHSRKLSHANGNWKCNDGPLHFFHFSGYTSSGSGVSSHIPLSVARHVLSKREGLEELFDSYKELLLQNGYEQTSNWPYTYSSFKSGQPIRDHIRRYYRRIGDGRTALGNPFASEQLERMAANGNTPGEGALTADDQLKVILNSRAWQWVSRYGRLKDRLVRVFRSKTIN